MASSAQAQILMQGNFLLPPNQLVTWVTYGQPDTNDLNSGFPGQLDPNTIT